MVGSCIVPSQAKGRESQWSRLREAAVWSDLKALELNEPVVNMMPLRYLEMKSLKSKNGNAPCSDASIFSNMAAVALVSCVKTASRSAGGEGRSEATNEWQPDKEANFGCWPAVVPGDDQGQS